MPLAEGEAATLTEEWHRNLGTATDAVWVARAVVQRLGEPENYHRLATPPDTTHPGAARVATILRTSYRELVHQNQVDALAAALAPEVASHPNPAAAIAHRCDLALM
jgi:hypothetical protein